MTDDARRAADGVRRFASPAGLALAAALGPATARAAEPPRVDVAWDAPAGCPDRDAVLARTASLLGADIESRATRPFQVRAVVTRGPTEFQLDLDTRDGDVRGARRLTGATCEEVSYAGALILALAVDPQAVASHASSGTAAFATASPAPAPAAPAPAPVCPPPPPCAAPACPPPPPGPPAERESRVAARGVLDVGTLPGAAGGLGLEATAALPGMRVRLGATYLTPRFADAPTPSGASKGADLSLLAADLSGCYALPIPVGELGLCGGLESGALLARGRGFERPTSAVAPWLAALAGVEVSGSPVPWLTLRAGVGGAVPVGRSPVRFRNADGDLQELTRPSVVALRAVVAAGVSFR